MSQELSQRLANLKQFRAPSVEVTLPADVNAAGELVMDKFKLAFDFNAIVAVKNQAGKSLLNADTWDAMFDDPELFRVVLWAGLLLYQPTISLLEVNSMLQAAECSGLLLKIMEAWQASKPKPNPTPESLAEPAVTLEKATQ